jgi:hypothetical protein
VKYLAAVCTLAAATLISYFSFSVLGSGVMTLFAIGVAGSAFYFGLPAGTLVATGGVLFNSYWFNSYLGTPAAHTLQMTPTAGVAYLIMLFLLAFFADREGHSKQRVVQTLDSRTSELQAVMALVCPRLPVCGECGKFQTEQGEWTVLQRYVEENYPAREQSFCPECVRLLHVQAQDDLDPDAP